MNATAEKFGYPETKLAELAHWLVLLRPAQVTLGSLVLVCREPVGRFGDISPAASAELGGAVARIERALSTSFAFDKINYLMLMMVDPDVHFHVIPRYAAAREYAGLSFDDPFWPGPPDVSHRQELPADVRDRLIADLRGRFASAPGSR